MYDLATVINYPFAVFLFTNTCGSIDAADDISMQTYLNPLHLYFSSTNASENYVVETSPSFTTFTS